MYYFRIENNPSGRAYKKLISFFALNSTHFELSLYQYMSGAYGDNTKKTMDFLRKYLISTKKASENAGNRVGRYHALELYRYQINSETVRYLKNNAQNLYDWGDKLDFPEDLTFYQDRKLVYFSVGHEGDGYFQLETAKLVRKIKEIEGVEFTEIEEEDWL